MRTGLLLVIAAAVVLVVATGTAGAASCAASGSTTVRTTKVVRLYDVRLRDVAVHYGCSRRSGRKTYLGQTTSDPGADHLLSTSEVRLRGSNAADVTTDCINPRFLRGQATADCQTWVISYDLRRGRVRHFHFASVQPPTQNFVTHVVALVLQRSGSVAWTTRTRRVVETDAGDPVIEGVEVARMTPAGYRLLDAGLPIDPTVLVLTGTQLSWKRGDARRSARLP